MDNFLPSQLRSNKSQSSNLQQQQSLAAFTPVQHQASQPALNAQHNVLLTEHDPNAWQAPGSQSPVGRPLPEQLSVDQADTASAVSVKRKLKTRLTEGQRITKARQQQRNVLRNVIFDLNKVQYRTQKVFNDQREHFKEFAEYMKRYNKFVEFRQDNPYCDDKDLEFETAPTPRSMSLAQASKVSNISHLYYLTQGLKDRFASYEEFLKEIPT